MKFEKLRRESVRLLKIVEAIIRISRSRLRLWESALHSISSSNCYQTKCSATDVLTQ